MKTSAPSVRFLNETPLFKIPLPSCSSHAGLLSHLSLRRRRRAVPAGLVENGNSGPRRPGKWRSEHGRQRAEKRGSVSCHPSAQGRDVVSLPPVSSIICLLFKLCPLLVVPCWLNLCLPMLRKYFNANLTRNSIGRCCRCMKAVCFCVDLKEKAGAHSFLECELLMRQINNAIKDDR